MVLRIVTEDVLSLKTGTIIEIFESDNKKQMTHIKILGYDVDTWISDVAIIWFTTELKEGV